VNRRTPRDRSRARPLITTCAASESGRRRGSLRAPDRCRDEQAGARVAREQGDHVVEERIGQAALHVHDRSLVQWDLVVGRCEIVRARGTAARERLAERAAEEHEIVDRAVANAHPIDRGHGVGGNAGGTCACIDRLSSREPGAVDPGPLGGLHTSRVIVANERRRLRDEPRE
jgi:hypothetical protein